MDRMSSPVMTSTDKNDISSAVSSKSEEIGFSPDRPSLILVPNLNSRISIASHAYDTALVYSSGITSTASPAPPPPPPPPSSFFFAYIMVSVCQQRCMMCTRINDLLSCTSVEASSASSKHVNALA